MSETSGNIELVSELTPIQRWLEEIKLAEQELTKFHERGRKVTRRFLDERDVMEAGNKWFNVYYANTNIMESALYAQLPKPAVTRRFKDYEDDVARVAALIIQRSITQDLDDPRDTFDSTMRACVQDRLIPGLAAAWLRLETDTAEIPYDDIGETGVGEPETEENGAPPGKPEPMMRVTDQRVCVDYVFWQDFLWSPCRIWEERRWVGRKCYMTRAELIKRFGKKKGKLVPLDYHPTKMGHNVQGSTPQYEAMKKACIYEIWDRTNKKVYWISKGYPTILDEKPDPLNLVGFEPCPTPMLANITTSNCTPRPDYYMIQDQYSELDTLNNRISMLMQACKVIGVYDKGSPGISRMLNEGFDNQLIPVDNWAAFAEKGGVKGVIDWLPLEVVVTALSQLVASRELIKAQIYELTGISDIVRGATKASETLGAQQLKSKFASIAIKKRQDQVARFAAEILRIKAEIQVKHFTPELLLKKSNIMSTGQANQQYIQPAMEMLATDEGFEWRIQVTADSIAQADYAMEKADRVEFLTAASTYIEKAAGLMSAQPKYTPILIGMLKWATAGFQNTADLEGMLDEQLDALSKAPPPPPPPDPNQGKLQLLQAQGQQKMQLAQATGQQKMQQDAQTFQLEQARMQAELQMQERLNQMDMRMKEMEFNFKVKELELKEREMTMQFRMDEAQAARDERTALIEQHMAMQNNQAKHQMDMEQSAEQHTMAMKQAKAQASMRPNGQTH